jgi:hypothetical protein
MIKVISDYNDLEVYSKTKLCPKCGYDIVGVKAIKRNSFGVRIVPFKNSLWDTLMERICNACGHTWYEKPLDADNEIIYK